MLRASLPARTDTCKLLHSLIILSQTIKDWHLILFVTFLVAVDVTILVVAAAIPTARLEAKLVTNEENTHDERGVIAFILH